MFEPFDSSNESSVAGEMTGDQEQPNRVQVEELLQILQQCEAAVDDMNRPKVPEAPSFDMARQHSSTALSSQGEQIDLSPPSQAQQPTSTRPLDAHAEAPVQFRRIVVQKLAKLAGIYLHALRSDDSRKIYELAVMEGVDSLGRRDVDTLRSLEGLALVYRKTGRLDEAVILYRQILDRRRLDSGFEDDVTLRTAVNFAIALVFQGSYHVAVEEAEKVVAAFDKRFGDTHPDTIWCTAFLEDVKRMRDDKFSQLAMWNQYSLAKLLYDQSNAAGGRAEWSNDVNSESKVISEAERSAKRAERPLPFSSDISSLFDEHGARSIQLAAWYQDDGYEFMPYSLGPWPERTRDGPLPPVVLSDEIGIYSRFLDVMKVNFGLDVNLMNRGGWNALHSAAYRGDLDRMRVFLSRKDIKADIPTRDTGETPLLLAITGKKPAAVELLLQRPDVNPAALDANSRTTLILAASNQLEVAQRLLETGLVDVNHVSNEKYDHYPDTALTAAAGQGNEAMVRLLLDAGARDNASAKQSALLAALKHEKNHGIARLLLQRASPNVCFRTPDGWTALHRAKTADMCKTLLDFGATSVINVANLYGWTPLHQASGEVAKVLLDHGADPTIPDKEGNTPLLKAVWSSDHDKLQLLLDSCKDEVVSPPRCRTVDVANVYGETPLSVAFSQGKEKQVAMLIAGGASVSCEALCALDGQIHRDGKSFPYPTDRSKKEMLEFVRKFTGDRYEQETKTSMSSTSDPRSPVVPSRL